MTKLDARAAIVLSCFLFVGPLTAGRTNAADENPAHEQLREMRRGLVAAVEKADLDSMLTFFHKDVVITWLNGEQSRGHEQVREYYNRMMRGEKRIVKSFKLENVEVAHLTTLYGDDSGVAYGTAKSHFVLTDGKEMNFEGPWTAALVKQDGKWLVTAFHASASVFDNPVLAIATGWIAKAAAIAGVVGLLLGAGVVLIMKRSRPQPRGAVT